jgi:hypothetical protein
MRSHARAMGCNAVVGYSESTSICDELCLLSALGTAANLNLPGLPLLSVVRVGDIGPTSSTEKREKDSDTPVRSSQQKETDIFQDGEDFDLYNPFEIPYCPTNLPFPTTIQKSPLDRYIQSLSWLCHNCAWRMNCHMSCHMSEKCDIQNCDRQCIIL